MSARARRLPSRFWRRRARRAVRAMCLWSVLLAATATNAQSIETARFSEPTARYSHGVLGDAIEWGALVITVSNGRSITLTLPSSRVFEDLEPRLADLDGDGSAEVIVVETSQAQGARLSIYDASGLIAATPFIGQENRWLAPIGAADLDRDGYIEIAYIDRPHLNKTLRIWRYRNGRLIHVADRPNLTNHQIGWAFIPGGIRDCGQGSEIITAKGDWSRIVASRLERGKIKSRDLDAYTGPKSLKAAMSCH